ncbi:MAG: glycosyltransferase family 1 protein [Gemmatimonadetes bacterium]|nr:glycosyltransferase family 1 protein [Gemmatimonadota bacterium]
MTGPRVAFDVTQATADPAGTGRYAASLASALQAQLHERFIPIRFGPLGKPAEQPTAARRLAFAARDMWWGPVGVARAARAAGADLLHLPVPVGPLAGGFPFVVTIHDLAVLTFPQYFRPWFRNVARVMLPRVARAARAVLTVSEASKRELVEHLGLSPERVVVTPNGVDPEFQPEDPEGPRAREVRGRLNLPASFILCVGTVEPRKNLPRVFEALAVLRRQAGDVRLIHAGPDGWLHRDTHAAVARHGLTGAVTFLGRVPRTDLPVLYSLARLLAYPSVCEGFGFPVLEAMACGCPVLTADRSSLPEVAGDAAVLVDPYSVTAIAEGMTRLWHDEALRARLALLGRARARRYVWAHTADLTMRVYHEVLGRA